jgi:hypothetical protein
MMFFGSALTRGRCRMRLGGTVFGVFLAVTVAACGGSAGPRLRTTVGPSTSEAVPSGSAPSAGAASVACGDEVRPHPVAAQRLPTGFPTVTGWAATQAVTQGKTVALRGAVRGSPDDIVHVRDEALKKITASGYTKAGSDQEPGFEADADFSGPHPGNINVKPLCRDYLVVTYTFEQ